MSNDLIVVEDINPVEVFVNGGLDDVLKNIETQANALASGLEFDLTQESNRKEIASVAYKVTRSRTALFNAAKELTEEWRENTKKVNNERSRMEENLKALEEKIRAPLTEYETIEKERVEIHKEAIETINNLCVFVNDPSLEEVQERINLLKDLS